MKNFKLVGWLMAGWALQTVVFPHLPIFGVVPDLFFVWLILVVVLRGLPEGLFWGLGLGLVYDLTSSPYYLHTMGLVVFAVLAVSLRKSIAGEGMGAVIRMILVLTPIYNCFLFLMFGVFYRTFFSFSAMFSVILVSTLLNAFCLFLVYPILSPFFIDERKLWH